MNVKLKLSRWLMRGPIDIRVMIEVWLVMRLTRMMFQSTPLGLMIGLMEMLVRLFG